MIPSFFWDCRFSRRGNYNSFLRDIVASMPKIHAQMQRSIFATKNPRRPEAGGEPDH